MDPGICQSWSWESPITRAADGCRWDAGKKHWRRSQFSRDCLFSLTCGSPAASQVGITTHRNPTGLPVVTRAL